MEIKGKKVYTAEATRHDGVSLRGIVYDCGKKQGAIVVVEVIRDGASRVMLVQKHKPGPEKQKFSVSSAKAFLKDFLKRAEEPPPPTVEEEEL